MKILIVEDEVAIRTGLAGLIKNLTTHDVVGEAKNGIEGIAMIETQKPDLVFTDIKMPEMDGLQMLKKLHDKGIKQHVVILSGYSEFDYAQQAIRYGADDYLLKPITMQDISALLDKIEEKLAAENNAWLEGMAGAIREAVMHTSGDGQVEIKAELQEALFAPGSFCAVYMGRVGSAGVVNKQRYTDKLQELCAEIPQAMAFPFFYENPREIGCLLLGASGIEELHEKFEETIMHRTPVAIAWSAAAISKPEDLVGVTEVLRENIQYGMVLGTGKVITVEAAKNYLPDEFIFPQSIAGMLRKNICINNAAEIARQSEAFTKALRAGKYLPGQIKRGYEKITTLIADTVQEFDAALYKQMEILHIPAQIEAAYTYEDLESVLKEALAVLGNTKKREDIRNYIIIKAMNCIRENYQTGITLDEVARHLDITPEYLSALFNREVGINFAAFMRGFRISHAKRMLKGTEKKVYEIAEMVGYSDVKYFNRVFKEQEGISPKEYRAQG